MSEFSSLAVELVENIWAYVLEPQDIESFALTCHRVRDAGNEVLIRHKKLNGMLDREASDPAFGPLGHPYGLFEEMSRQHTIRFYVKEVVFSGSNHAWSSGAFLFFLASNIRQTIYEDHWTDDFALLKRNLSMILQPEKLDFWSSLLDHHNKRPMIALILATCPNVNSITLQSCSTIQGVVAARERLASDARFPTSLLQHLKHLKLTHLYTYKLAPQQILALASIPSVETIQIEGVALSNGYGGMYTDIALPQHSNAKELIFDARQVDTEGLFRLLNGFRKLTRFRFYDNSRLTSPHIVCNAISTHVHNSLEYLQILLPRVDPTWTIQEINDVRRFTALKTLELSYCIWPSLRWTYQSSFPLKLPPSIEKIIIQEGSTDNRAFLNALATRISLYKSKYFPNLRSVEVNVVCHRRVRMCEYCEKGYHIESKQVLESLGIALTVTCNTDNSHWTETRSRFQRLLEASVVG